VNTATACSTTLGGIVRTIGLDANSPSWSKPRTSRGRLRYRFAALVNPVRRGTPRRLARRIELLIIWSARDPGPQM
jgi:hypothetical protein